MDASALYPSAASMTGARVALVAMSLAACGVERRSSLADPATSAIPVVDASPVASELPADADAGVIANASLASLIRAEDWNGAKASWERLSTDEKKRADYRYARARIALKTNEPGVALSALDDLERELPLLSDDLALRTAEANFGAKKYAEAGEYYARQHSPKDLLKGARAFAQGGLADRAARLLELVLQSRDRSRLDEADARAERIALKLRSAAQDSEDARWIEVHAPDSPRSDEASKMRARLSPGAPLDGRDEIERAKALSEAGQAEEALRAIDRAATLPNAPPKLDRLRLRAEVLMKARLRPMEAVHVLLECVQIGGPGAAEDSFRIARAYSRADRDDEAIERYQQTASKYPGTKWADESTFLAARLHAIHARWSKALVDFEAYRKAYPRGAYRLESLRYLALANLIIKANSKARTLFEELSADERDPFAQASAKHLAALAAERAGDRTHAIAVWSSIITNSPYSWQAVLARERITSAQGTPPPLPIAPATPLPSAKLPPPVDLLARFGFDGDAERALIRREREVEKGIEGLCRAYSSIDRGRRLYELSSQVPPAFLITAPSTDNAWAWRCVYPTPFQELELRLERELKLPVGLVHAVMRQESNFLPEAMSPARAIGLMQLISPTAKTVAARLKLALDEEDLKNPNINIRLGANYLQELVDGMKGNLPLTVAAYNAGPDAVDRWKARQKGMDLDLFLEQIPFVETRGYVARVLSNYVRYRTLAGLPELKVSLELD